MAPTVTAEALADGLSMWEGMVAALAEADLKVSQTVTILTWNQETVTGTVVSLSASSVVVESEGTKFLALDAAQLL